MKNIFARIHKVLALFIAVGVFLQMFLAGVWHAGVVDTPDAHIFFGLSMLLAALVALISALIAGAAQSGYSPYRIAIFPDFTANLLDGGTSQWTAAGSALHS